MSIEAKDNIGKYSNLGFVSPTSPTFQDNGSGFTRVNFVGHPMRVGDIASFGGTVNINGSHKVTAVDSDWFDIDFTYPNDANDDGVGRFTNILLPSRTYIQGKLPSELGLIDRSTNTDIKNFYTQVDKNQSQFYLNGVNQTVDIPNLFDGTQPFILVFDFFYYGQAVGASLGKGLIGTTGGSFNNDFVLFADRTEDNALYWTFITSASSLTGKRTPAETLKENTDNRVIAIFTGDTSSGSVSHTDFRLFLNGVEYTDIAFLSATSTVPMSDNHRLGSYVSGSNRWLQVGYKKFQFYDNKIPTDEEIRDLIAGLEISNITRRFNFEEIEGNKIIDNISKEDLLLSSSNISAEELIIGAGKWRDNNSLVPRLKFYTPFNSSLSFSAPMPAIDQNFSNLVCFRIVDATISKFILSLRDTNPNLQGSGISQRLEGGGVIPRFRLGRAGATGPSWDFSYKDLGSKDFTFLEDEFYTIILNRTRVSTDQYTTKVYVNGKEFPPDISNTNSLLMTLITQAFSDGNSDKVHSGVFTDHFTEKEIADIGVFGLPSKEKIQTAFGYWQYQSVINSGGSPAVKDWSGNDRHKVITGLPAGTVQEQIDSYRESLQDILKTNRVPNLNGGILNHNI